MCSELTVKYSGTEVENISIIAKYHSSFLFVCQNLIKDFKVLTRFSESSCFSFTSNKVFYFSHVNVSIACHFSKIHLQSERSKMSKTFGFLFQKPSNFYSEKKSCSLKVAVFEFQKYRKKLAKILQKFLKNKHEHELFHMYFSVIFLLFRNICLKE